MIYNENLWYIDVCNEWWLIIDMNKCLSKMINQNQYLMYLKQYNTRWYMKSIFKWLEYEKWFNMT